MKTLSYLVGKFEKLLEHLPGAIRKPVEREWRPLKELFLQRRPAWIMVVGSKPETAFRTLFQAENEQFGEMAGPWRTFHRHGALHFAIAGELISAAKNAITARPPDLFLFIAGEENKSADLSFLKELHRFDCERYQHPTPIVAAGAQMMELMDAVHSDSALSPSVAAVLPMDNRHFILTAVANALPNEARLEFARVSGEKAVQREIAMTLTRSISGVCTAIGAQPIPLADFPILTSLQVLLISGIVHVTGKEWSLATGRDFLGALGANIGAGLALRETARAAVKLLPGWGSAISGAIAGAGTWAIGRAAIGYFIEGVTIEEARRRFRRERKSKQPKKIEPEKLPDSENDGKSA